MKIAFFDSGIGGLTVLHESIKLLPHEQYIYFADSANIPYGTKSNKEIKACVFPIVSFLMSKNIKALVLACNTATSIIVKELRRTYTIPIIGMEPALKPALSLDSNKRILLCATKLTLREEKLNKLIKDNYAQEKVVLRSLQPLVDYAERFEFDSPEVLMYLNEVFGDINDHDYSSVVLGCTHFLYFKPQIKSILGNKIKIIDGNKGTANRLSSLIDPADQNQSSTIEFYSSNQSLDNQYFNAYIEHYINIQELELE